MVSRRRTRSAVAGPAKIGSRLQRSIRQLRCGRIAGIERKLGRARWNVDHQPMPEPATGRRVRVEAGDGEALGAGRSFRPGQLRRLVATRAAETEIGRQDVVGTQIVAILERLAGDLERHASPPVALEFFCLSSLDGRAKLAVVIPVLACPRTCSEDQRDPSLWLAPDLAESWIP